MRIGYCKPECSTGGAHIIFKGEERLESSILLQVSCLWNLQAYIVVFSKKQKAQKFKHYQKSTYLVSFTSYSQSIIYFYVCSIQKWIWNPVSIKSWKPHQKNGEKHLGKLNGSVKETYGFKCRKCPPVVKELVHFEEKNRMECMGESEAYITIKDHQENFPGKPNFRLINPSESDMGKVSKCILDQIN